jgi:hypothetical protein
MSTNTCCITSRPINTKRRVSVLLINFKSIYLANDFVHGTKNVRMIEECVKKRERET